MSKRFHGNLRDISEQFQSDSTAISERLQNDVTTISSRCFRLRTSRRETAKYNVDRLASGCVLLWLCIGYKAVFKVAFKTVLKRIHIDLQVISQRLQNDSTTI